MKETIYTIPINEAFEAKCGCPLCTLARRLERDSVEYIMGAAMMEPDVRIETNRRGFCEKHYGQMLAMNGRLSLALTLESRLGEIRNYIEKEALKGFGKKLDTAKAAELIRGTAGGCFVCERIAGYEEHYYKNILHMWKQAPDFRELFAGQPFFCLEHTAGLLKRAPEVLGKRGHEEFDRMLIEIVDRYLKELNDDVSAFCQSFDYRSAGKVLGEAQKIAPERAIEFLSGYHEEEEKK
ncbi:MAG: hypothetical protein E7458_04540 [Ruminococcaceae bacterium]|nr:hypothetical protein [Oscillospiraceae bacterium]